MLFEGMRVPLLLRFNLKIPIPRFVWATPTENRCMIYSTPGHFFGTGHKWASDDRDVSALSFPTSPLFRSTFNVSEKRKE